MRRCISTLKGPKHYIVVHIFFFTITTSTITNNNKNHSVYMLIHIQISQYIVVYFSVRLYHWFCLQIIQMSNENAVIHVVTVLVVSTHANTLKHLKIR